MVANKAKAGNAHVYAVMRTDYEDSNDDEGRSNFISCHGSVSSANRGARAHVKDHCDIYSLEDPNSNESTYKDKTIGIKVMVNEEGYHSFEVGVHKEELHDGTVIPDEDPTDVVQEATTKKGKANA